MVVMYYVSFLGPAIVFSRSNDPRHRSGRHSSFTLRPMGL